jgi:hypothetical protein
LEIRSGNVCGVKVKRNIAESKLPYLAITISCSSSLQIYAQVQEQ